MDKHEVLISVKKEQTTMKTSLDIIVRPTEIDVNGHVNNAKYLEYLEWGREEWYEAGDLRYDVLKQLGVQTVTVNININYRKECSQGDRLTISTEPKSVGRTSYVMLQQIHNKEGELCADAEVTSVAMDPHTRKSRSVPEELRRLFPS
ncbi:thioesterase superfamily protein [Paenibacillus vortex V453]|uniref:Thioesterase superfamily protein n=2 Tax=Paenibacillus TaxID=44249 RepID=A0A2R9SVE8_9BACL|nr:thioesterase family protein [Paenibacillus glucanolyticus]AWP28444.1 thioesterase [Paenibacillus sp. Cedars]EFU41337.1 thioesterase superfamily protein [Paenibacillus vortex V453]